MHTQRKQTKEVTWSVLFLGWNIKQIIKLFIVRFLCLLNNTAI